MTVIFDDQIIRFFRLAWVGAILIALSPLYFGRKNIIAKKELSKILTYFSLYAFLGLLLEENFNRLNLSKEEFEIILLFFTIVLSGFVIPRIYPIVIPKFEQTLTLNTKGAFELTMKTLDKIKAKVIKTEEQSFILARFKASYSFEYHLEFSIARKQKTEIAMLITPVGTIITRARIVFLLMVYPVIYALGENSFDLILPIFEYQFNAEVSFVLIASFLGLMNFLQSSVQMNFIYEYEEIQKNSLMELLQNKSQKRKNEQSSTKPEERKLPSKFDTKTVREKAEKIKERQYKEEIENRKQKVQNRIDDVFGKKQETSIDPELVKKQLLIAKVKTVLKSTPLFREVSLKEITNKVEHENNEEIEKVIIYLIEQKEIHGNYDIWENIFYPGDLNSQYIEKTIREMKLNGNNLDFIKLTKSGDVEIRFKQKNDE